MKTRLTALLVSVLVLAACGKEEPKKTLSEAEMSAAVAGGWETSCLPKRFVDSILFPDVFYASYANSVKWMLDKDGPVLVISQVTFSDSACLTPMATIQFSAVPKTIFDSESTFVLRMETNSGDYTAHSERGLIKGKKDFQPELDSNRPFLFVSMGSINAKPLIWEVKADVSNGELKLGFGYPRTDDQLGVLMKRRY